MWIAISSTQEKKREAAELKQWIDRAAIARLSGWDRIRHDDITETYGFDTTIESRLKSGILGPKTLSRNGPRKAVLLRRSRLQYETEVSYYVDDQKDGFEVHVPLHNFQVRITWDRGTAECWDALYDAVCKIDRKVINSRKSKSQPLTYTSTQPRNPSLQVRVL